MAKKRIKKIQDYDRAYSLLHRYVAFAIKHSYRSILHVGKENIPTDGAIIFAPNHTNALMDALVMLNIDLKPKVFVARADIFRNRKLAKALTFLKMMPIMRQRDGFNAVKKNQEIIDRSVDVLKDRMPFCIFPEGTHLAKYSSLPLSKGIFRIAMQALEQMPEMPLYIVPVGLRYGNLFCFRSTVRLQIGQPINVGEFMAENSHLSAQEQINAMKELLAERMKEVIFHIPNDDDYNAIYEICNAAEPVEVGELLKKKENRKKHRLELQFQANNVTLRRIAELKENAPDKAKKLIELGKEASVSRMSKGIDAESVAADCTAFSRALKFVLLLAALPYTLALSVLTAPTALMCKLIFTKLKDPAFRNSVRFLVYLFVWPLVLLIYTIILFCVLPWQWALPAVLLVLPAPMVAHDMKNVAMRAMSDIRLMKEKRLKKIYAGIKELIM